MMQKLFRNIDDKLIIILRVVNDLLIASISINLASVLAMVQLEVIIDEQLPQSDV